MITITRSLEFDAGHRVLGHEGRCKHLHGHRYKVEITVEAPSLDSLGRVIDFGVIKEKVGGWIDENLDHNMILHPEDPLFLLDTEDGPYFDIEIAERIVGRKPFRMAADTNPTAENIAEQIHNIAFIVLPKELDIKRVRVYETPNCWADYVPE